MVNLPWVPDIVCERLDVFPRILGCGGSFTKKNKPFSMTCVSWKRSFVVVGHYTPENSTSVSPNGKNRQPPDRSAVSKHQVSTCWSTCTEPLERGGDFRKRTRSKRSAAGWKKAGEEVGPQADSCKWEWTTCGWMKQDMGTWKHQREAIRDEDFF